jgi:iron complex transport system permease protein
VKREPFSLHPPILLVACIGFALVFLACLSLGFDHTAKPWDLDLWRDYFSGVENSRATILFSIRFPRLLLAGLAGGCLALAGLIFQNLLKNPLADPYVIGVSGGSGLAAVIIQIQGIHNPLVLIAGAFLGGLGTMLLVERLSTRQGRLFHLELILTGVILNAFFSAVISFLLIFSHQDMPRIIFWLMGSCNLPETRVLLPMACLALIAVGILLRYARHLNLLLLGEFQAFHLGIDPERVKWVALITASILTSIAVSMTGMIGFIGMFVPHALRFFFRGNHQMLIPLSFLGGGTLLILTDSFVRVMNVGREIPVGTVTALLGAPFFLFLMLRHKRATNR